MANQPKLTRNEQREAARAKARELREKHKTAERNKKVAIQASVVIGLLAIVGVIVVAITFSPQTKAGLTPRLQPFSMRAASKWALVCKLSLRPAHQPRCLCWANRWRCAKHQGLPRLPVPLL
jgi:hypothetical protein